MDQPAITINVGVQRDGYVFRPRPLSRVWLEENFPDKDRVSSVFVGFDNKRDFQQITDSVWSRIWLLLTGLTMDEINQVGGLIVINPRTAQQVYSSSPIHV